MDVTAGKALETQLRERIAIFNEAADATDFCVFGRNQVDGPYQWSDQVWAIHGLPRRETQPAAGELRALIHPADVARWAAEIAALRADPRRLLGEVGWRIVRPDGSTRHLVATIRYERDGAGVARTQRGILRDVTERRAADEARAASEAWLLEAAEGAEVGLFDRDLISGRAFWSPRNWEIFGVAPEGEAPSYERIMAIVHPDDRAEWGRVVSALPGDLESGGIDRGFRIVRGDGAVRHLVSRSKVLRDAGGRAVRNRGIIMDVTERRGAVEALHAEKERFRHAAEVAEMGVFERDMVTGVRTWSGRMWQIYGLAPRALAPSEEEGFSYLHPEDRHIVAAARARLMGEGSSGRESAEYRIVRPDGSVRHLAGSALVLRDAEGRPVRIHGVERDITEERDMRAKAMIAANMVTLGQMATGIAHEFGQPLQAITTAAAVLEGWIAGGCSPEGAESARRQVARIAAQAERAGQTMRHLLHFGRGGSSSGTTTAAAVVAGALDLVGASIRGSGVAIEVSVPGTLPAIQGAQLELEKVLVNLLLNARDAMEGRLERLVMVRAREEGGAIVMEIEDTGGGVPEGMLSRVFEPFFTTKEQDKGTGLGLAICKTTMQACGGDISVVNTGLGARFSLRCALAG